MSYVKLKAEIASVRAENERLEAIINKPETSDFLRGVSIEAEHARRRWKKDDELKDHWQWAGLVLFLAGKAVNAIACGDGEKFKHHCVSTAAALLNWHRAFTIGKIG